MQHDFPEKPYEKLAALLAEKADEYDKTLAVVGAPKEKESGPKKEKKVKQEVGKLDSEEAFPTLGGK